MSHSLQHLDHVDFIKGIAAISVILLHTLPVNILYKSLAVYHIWQAVPIFLFITFYLGFRNFEKKGNIFKGYYSKKRIKTLFLKLWLPLLILAILEAIFFYATGDTNNAKSSLLCYGNGPGSYYIWCYMQIWLMMPFIYLVLKRLGILTGGGILLIISILTDYLFERYVGCRHGFACFRYIFLSVPAYMYVKGVNNKIVIPLVLFSVIYLALMLYSKIPVYADPILPNGWEAQTSLGFFYTLFLFIALSQLYDKLKASKIKDYITHLGTISWEVFLVQMVLLGSGVLNYASSKLFDSVYLQISFRIIAAIVITLVFAELYKRILSPVYDKINKI